MDHVLAEIEDQYQDILKSELVGGYCERQQCGEFIPPKEGVIVKVDEGEKMLLCSGCYSGWDEHNDKML